MITLIVGEKGSGKTKAILNRANDRVHSTNGTLVFIDKDYSKMLNLTHKVRLINAVEYGILNDSDLVCFIKGILATDTDLTDIFVDSVLKITGKDISELLEFFASLEGLTEKYNVGFTLTISCSKDALPKKLIKFIDKEPVE